MMKDFKDVNKILVVKLRHIGDVLLTVPVFRALRKSFPKAHIAALVNSGTEETLSDNPIIDEIIVFDRGIKKRKLLKYFLELSFLKKIRNKGFAMTVDLTSGDRAAIISLFSGARYRLAYDPRGAGFIGKRHLYTHRAERNANPHIVLQNLDLLRQFGIEADNLTVDMFIPNSASAFVNKLFYENGIRDSDRVIHVHPTSRWLFKCWKDEHVAEVISWLAGKGVKVIVTSSPEKKELDKVASIISFVERAAHPNVVDLCGKTTIKHLGAISAASDLFFGVDSAPMHIAAAVGTPVVALFGPSGTEWRPWDNGCGKHVVVQRDWDCVPCGKDGCGGSKISDCLYNITAAEIISILTERLSL